jgi:hypothetical protein
VDLPRLPTIKHFQLAIRPPQIPAQTTHHHRSRRRTKFKRRESGTCKQCNNFWPLPIISNAIM